MSANTYYLELMYILLNIFQPQKLMNKTMKAENLFLKKKRQEALEKKLGCKFIRINTSNAKKGYDTDYEVSKMQIFASEFKDKEIKELENTRKENENKIKELEDEIKKLKLQFYLDECLCEL